MFHLFKYKTPDRYAKDFNNAYSYINVKNVRTLSTLILAISGTIRIIYFFYYRELSHMANFMEYNISNWIQISCAFVFFMMSRLFFKSPPAKAASRNLFTLIFVLFILYLTFSISYIFSLHNAKNTLTMFLIGIMAVSIFFALEFKHVTIASVFVIVLFLISISITDLNTQEKIFNVIGAFTLASVLYSFSRYSYYFKSQHFVQVRQLEEKNNEVEQLNRQKSEILGFVAHDLRNPLNNIEALSAMLLMEDLEQHIEIRMIQSSARQAKYIINDLIEVVQEEKAPLTVQNTNLSECLRKIVTHWQANVEEPRKINFKSNDENFSTPLNLSKFTRVIDNLIGNGLKFSAQDTPIEVELNHNTGICNISITDFGIGIPEHLQALLFDQFSKAGRPGLRGEKSMGLGLHISKQIMEQHGWQLAMSSRENEGTTFRISIPETSLN